MAKNELSIREASLYAKIKPKQPISIRKLLGTDTGAIRLRAKPFSLSIIIYNMALMVSPAPYKGTNRKGAIQELIDQITIVHPDIVGLCEVWSDDERENFRDKLKSLYPYFREGPDEDDLESDGGLLILSRYKIIKSHQSIFRQCAGMFADCLANKGIIYLQIQPDRTLTPIDIFFSHTQNIEENSGQQALYAQLTHLGNMVDAFGDPNTPTFIMGDLNIPAEVKANYHELITRLGNPIDLWAIKHPLWTTKTTERGFTFAVSSFYQDPNHSPKQNEQQRLDYILLKAGRRFIPISEKIELLKWSHGGHQISDHFGLHAQFEQVLEVKSEISGSISRVQVTITGFRCINETHDVSASDEILFKLDIVGENSQVAFTQTPQFKDVDTGEYRTVTGTSPATINGDPGSKITIQVFGYEIDSISNSEELSGKAITIERQDLLLYQGRRYRRFMPYLTGDDGEYGVEIEISVT